MNMLLNLQSALLLFILIVRNKKKNFFMSYKEPLFSLKSEFFKWFQI